MSNLTEDLQAFVADHGAEILGKFNGVLKRHPETAHLSIVQAKISYAAPSREGREPKVEKIEGGYIIWK